MKITASIKKSFYQDHGSCYLHYPIFSYIYTLLFCCKIKSCCNHCFSHQIRPMITAQLCILQGYSSVQLTGFNMNYKHHTSHK